MRVSSLIIKPVVTEKSIAMSSQGKYVFQVGMGANFGNIKQELKKLFNVDVISMHTIILPGKKRRIARTPRFMKTAKRKKVIVTLKKDQKLDILPKEK
jgi:large subunit ribosomal protein L23